MAARVRKAVFPVGGLGTRFLPATKAMPKEMLPVVDKPLIQYAVEEAMAAGIEEFIFVTGRGKSAIEDHFDYSYELETVLAARAKTDALEAVRGWLPPPGAVAYTRQQEPLGLGHAIHCARHLVGEEPFAVLLADDLILARTPCLKQLIAHFERRPGNVFAVMDVPREHVNRYGIVTPGADDGTTVDILGLVEKPDPAQAASSLAVIGRYVLMPGVMEHLEQATRGAGDEIQLTDSLARSIGREPFYGLRFEGRRFDCGDKIGFLHANLAFALTRADLRQGVEAILRDLAACESKTIAPRR